MSIIIDIGANVGNFTKEWLTKSPHSQYVCVEANVELIPILDGMFYGNKNVTILNNLVSDKDDELVDFWINKNHTISSASKDWINNSRFKGTDYYKKTQVKTITLDTIIELYGNPNLIKIDVEGYELEVLKGLTKAQSVIMFEWVEENFSRCIDCIKYLMSIGYNSFSYTIKENYSEIQTNYCPFNEMDIFKKINLIGNSNWGNIYAR